MLIDTKTGKIIHVASNKELSDHMKRSVRETLCALTHKGHKFFSLEERAVIKGLEK